MPNEGNRASKSAAVIVTAGVTSQSACLEPRVGPCGDNIKSEGQDRQCSYNVTLRRIRAAMVAFG